MEASTDFFICAIECNRIIYDKSSSDFKNVLKKEEAWNRIAKAVRMPVEAAKKRCNSIRQKYCREKQKMELYRRTKRVYRPWVFNERLQFLDPFIHPRATFTNDTGFDVEGGADSMHVAEVEHIDIDESEHLPSESLNNGTGDNNSEPTGLSETQIITYNDEDVQDCNSFEILDESEIQNNVCFSEYSGERTEITPFIVVLDSDRDNNVTTLNKPHDASHSSQIHTQQSQSNTNLTTLSKPRDASQSSQISTQQSQSDANLTTLNIPRIVSLTSTTTSEQFDRDNNLTTQNGSRGVNQTLRIATTTQRNQVNVPSSSVRQTTFIQPSNTSTNQVNAASSSIRQTTLIQPSNTSTSLKDKNMEAIRNKMDSCLTAIAAKAADKPQRSMHAPFLAYLGTKLPIVPAEKLPALEMGILKMVEDACL